MTLPGNLQPWENLQDVLQNTYNRIVRSEFNDVGDDDWDNDPDIRTARSQLRLACTIWEQDSAIICLVRMFLFYIILQQAKALQAPVYGVPVTSFQETRRFKPQIQLYFEEDINDVDAGFAPVTGEISFRLMNESEESISLADARTLANKIKSTFASGMGFSWKKGKFMCSYTDRKKGYQLQLLCRNAAEGRRVIEQVLDVQNHTPNWALMNVSENQEPAERHPTLPPMKQILGKSRRLPRSRPVADVRFQYATLHVWGVPTPTVLIDRSGTHLNPLVEMS